MISLLLAVGLLSTPPPEKFTLPTGATLIVQPDPSATTVSICCFVKAAIAEEEGQGGLAALTARSIFGSNDNQSREAVSRDLTLAGGSLEIINEHDYTLFTSVTDRAAFRDAMYSLGQALKTAQFDQETVEWARRSLTSDAARYDADPFQKAFDAVRSRLFAAGPYRVPVGPGAESIQRIRPPALQTFYRKRYAPTNTVISVCGNITAEEARRSAENQLVDFDRVASRTPSWSSGTAPSEPVHVVRKAPIKTRIVVAGFRGPGVVDPDYPAWLVLNTLLGGGKGSRLFRSVRDVSGVGYSVVSRASKTAKDGGLMAVVEYDPARSGADGKPIETAAVEKLILDAVRSISASAPSEREIERARNFAVGELALAHERTRDRAFYLGWYESIGAGFALDAELPKKIEAVTAADVVALAKKWLKNEVIVVVEPAVVSP